MRRVKWTCFFCSSGKGGANLSDGDALRVGAEEKRRVQFVTKGGAEGGS